MIVIIEKLHGIGLPRPAACVFTEILCDYVCIVYRVFIMFVLIHVRMVAHNTWDLACMRSRVYTQQTHVTYVLLVQHSFSGQ